MLHITGRQTNMTMLQHCITFVVRSENFSNFLGDLSALKEPSSMHSAVTHEVIERLR